MHWFNVHLHYLDQLFFNRIYVKEAKFHTIFFANVKNVIQGICKIVKGRAMCMVTLNCKMIVKKLFSSNASFYKNKKFYKMKLHILAF